MKLVKKDFPLGKKDFPLGKMEFGTHSVHTSEYLLLLEALLARLYLKVKVYITNLLSVYNLLKISCIK